MKKIKEFYNVERLLFSNRPIIQKLFSAEFIDQNLNTQLITEGNIYYARVINGTFYFQLSNENNLNVLLNGQVVSKNGSWGLITAFPVSSDKFYIYFQEPEKHPKFLILNMALEIITESLKDCKYGFNNYLFWRFRNKIICFDSLTEKTKWESEQATTINQSVFFEKDFVFITLTTGDLLALNVANGDLKWKQERMGRVTLFDHKIYCITDYTLKELDTNTGDILQEESMHKLIELYRFRPTGEHKVYDEYIFAMASGKPGLVAIFNRKTLQFKEMLTINDMIPVGTDHLIWHEGRLFILDFGKTLHVYEES